jgi:hypothetical protein
MKEQGHLSEDNIVYQDNQAAILLEKNGKASSGKRTKHINARYFFITDRISKREVKVKWCPTEDMTGDFWTKPLQGASFCRMRDLIMGVVPQELPRKSKTKKKKQEVKGNTASEHERPKQRVGNSHSGRRSALELVQ